MAVPIPLPLLLLGVFAVLGGCSDPGPHTLRYFYTAVSEPSPGLPRFTVVGYLDDHLFFHYDSATKQAQARAPWIRAEGPDYWDRQTWIARGWQEAFSGNVRIAMERYNQSGGQHTFQYTYGCTLRGAGFRQYGYDGRDFLSYDGRAGAWVAPSREAAITKAKMEGDSHLSRQQRDYLERKCLEWLRKYLAYGNGMLQRKEHPAVRVTSRDTPGGPSTLSCRAHGFYPRPIALSWLRGGQIREQETWRRGVLPNGDGTYHAWATVEINPQERGLYSCQVEHESLARPLVAVWEPAPHSPLVPALIAAVVGGLLVAGIVGFLLWKRRRSAKHCSASQQGSDQDSSASLQASDKGSSRGSDPGYETNSSLESVAGQQPAGGPGTRETHLPAAAQPLLPARVSAPPDGDPTLGIV
ncbi:class I histocompatibility antigen, F10 alpha chain-like [Emydura macquarii macquarii]|uniref:class I histocompatibility antigen, F10 alpha chain-like n=1 Tax=Emydura macquarii macquarii TaxID=1129001 RepID=UPI00352A7330